MQAFGVGLGTLQPRVEFIKREDVFQRVHPAGVGDRCERGGDFAADFLGGRILSSKDGIGRLKQLELLEHRVVFRVGDQRSIILVIGLAVGADLLDQLFIAGLVSFRRYVGGLDWCCVFFTHVFNCAPPADSLAGLEP